MVGSKANDKNGGGYVVEQYLHILLATQSPGMALLTIKNFQIF